MTADKRFPIVTVLLLGANLVAAFAILLDPDLGLAGTFGFRSDMPSVRTAFTCLFLHANLFHLLGNMVFLAAVGAAVEIGTGSIRFAGVYFASGLAGVLFHFLATRHNQDPQPLIGASAAIAGCAGYYSVRYTGLRVPVLPNLSVSVAGVTGVWIALQLIGAFVRLGDTGGVAFWSHIGGFTTGLLLSFLFRAPDLGQVRLGHEVLERMNSRSPVAAATAAKRHLERHPGDIKALQQLARACAQTDDRQGEADTILQLMELESEEELPKLTARLIDLNLADRLSSHKRTIQADKFKESHPALARALLASVVKGPLRDSQRPEALLALVALEREGQPSVAQTLLDELIQSYPLHPCADIARKKGWVS